MAAEVAQFDQLSGGRLILGIGPGGLMSDAELFGDKDMPARYGITLEALDLMTRLWSESAPLTHQVSTLTTHWAPGLAQPRCRRDGQTPAATAPTHRTGHGRTRGLTAETIAGPGFHSDIGQLRAGRESLCPVAGLLRDPSETRQPADRMIWRVCPNILVTDSDARAEDILADPDGVFAYYYRYIRGVRN
ncbi:MAG: hypothetical protein Ct9H300mP16_01550 [Pseudomonadota bacterium]|nr:MAG: hypothetical protein Ct9H300mP16_01550 [Pseudomonadota bacterium]